MVFSEEGPVWKTLCSQPLESTQGGAWSLLVLRRRGEGMERQRACPAACGCPGPQGQMDTCGPFGLKTTLVPQAEGRGSFLVIVICKGLKERLVFCVAALRCRRGF